MTDKEYLTPAEVRELIDGLDRDTLNRWTRLKWIHAESYRDGRKRATYLYPVTELSKIRRMTELVHEGYAPRNAFRKYNEETDLNDPTMSVTDLIRKIPGLVPNRLYYWESQGWVNSISEMKGTRNVRRYTIQEFEKVNQAMRLINIGYSPRGAFEKINLTVDATEVREPADISYVKEPSDEMRRDFEKLKTAFEEFAKKYNLLG
jgi:hypothetical protein